MNRFSMVMVAGLMSMAMAPIASAAQVSHAMQREAVKTALASAHINVQSLRVSYKTGTLSGKGSTNPGAFPESFKAKYTVNKSGRATLMQLTTKDTGKPNTDY